MDKLDTYYRALTEYRARISANHDCTRATKSVSENGTDSDVIEITRHSVTVDEDWIDEIEKGLEFVGKAIAEERQFIQSEGDVTPIEKVKNTSRESAEHLARHSEYITKKPAEGENLVPDRLYTVERLTDYAVYENRFLYMLLCYLNDFITSRYEEIVALISEYAGSMSMDKNVKTAGRTFRYTVVLDETLRDDKYLLENTPLRDTVSRIDAIMKAVVSYLATPLMEEVGKSPMLKPPITETNVLKLNWNFHGALNLYYYVVAYQGKGYTDTVTTERITPFPTRIADEFAETANLASFLTYEHGLGIEKDLKKRYDRIIAEEEEKEKQRQAEKINDLKKRIDESGDTIYEYILALESRNAELEVERLDLSRKLADATAELSAARERIEKLENENGALTARVAELSGELEQKIREIEEMKILHEREIRALTEKHEEEMRALTEQYEEEIRVLNEQHEEEIRALTEKYEEEIRVLNEQHEEEIRVLNEQHEEEIRSLNEQHEEEICELNEKHDEEMRDLAERYAEEIRKIEDDYLGQIDRLKENHEREINAKNEEIKRIRDEAEDRMASTERACNEKIDSLVKRYDAEIAAARKAADAQKDGYEKKIMTADNTIAELDRRLEAGRRQLAAMTEKRYVAEARVNALKEESGLYDGDEDYTSRGGFGEIEKQYNYFRTFFKKRWTETKREIKNGRPKGGVSKEELKKMNAEMDETDDEEMGFAQYSAGETYAVRDAESTSDMYPADESAEAETYHGADADGTGLKETAEERDTYPADESAEAGAYQGADAEENDDVYPADESAEAEAYQGADAEENDDVYPADESAEGERDYMRTGRGAAPDGTGQDDGDDGLDDPYETLQ